MVRIAQKAGKRFQGGVVLHSGGGTYPLNEPESAPPIHAVPLSMLWEM